MKKIVFITYYFSPQKTIGTIRITKWLKYLSQSGYTCHVITQNKGINIDSIENTNNGCICRLKNPWVVKNKVLARILYLFGIDDISFWIFTNINKIIFLINKLKPNIVVLTVPPGFLIIIIPILRLFYSTNVKFIIDFRDAYSLDPSYLINYGSKLYDLYLKFKSHLIRLLEYFILKSTNIVTYATENIFLDYSSLFPWVKCKSHVIYNGFEKNKYENKNNEKCLIFTYAGNFDGPRKPDIFFMAIERYFINNPEIINHVKINFYGENDKISKSIKKYLVYSSCLFNFNKRVDQSICLQHLRASDVNIIINDIPANKRGYQIITGKIFDYISVEKIIWGIIPEKGDAYDLIKNGNLGFYSSNESIESISWTFGQIIKKWENNNLKCNYNYDYLNKYENIYNLNLIRNIIEKLDG